MEVNVGQNKLFWHPWLVHISLWKKESIKYIKIINFTTTHFFLTSQEKMSWFWKQEKSLQMGFPKAVFPLYLYWLITYTWKMN